MGKPVSPIACGEAGRRGEERRGEERRGGWYGVGTLNA
jgi:hypothetical protein